MERSVEVVDLSQNDILDLKVDTKYCVERNIHDAHVKRAEARRYPSIPAAMSPADVIAAPIAIVCSGPSLKNSWEEIKGFKFILSCSGATDYLVERGIIPTWHMETDPREHKATFVQHPRPDIQYLIASNCHPKVFEALEGCDVRLWHVLGSENHRGIYETHSRNHWVLTGGSNVGLRALVMARVLGYVDMHIFGMDCSGDESSFHTGFHPNEPKKEAMKIAKVGEKEYSTTNVWLHYARQYFKETLKLSDAKFTLHGEGLLQELVKQKVSDPKYMEERKKRVETATPEMIAMMVPATCSPEYALANYQLHQEKVEYGIGGEKHAPLVIKLRDATKAQSILDYGCGKGLLAKALPFPIWEYDPAIPGKDDPPRPADLTICTDVLEHIEPEYLDLTLLDLARCTLSVGFFVITTEEALKQLPDGRNTHLLVKPRAWWTEKLSQFFKIGKVIENGYEVWFIVAPNLPKPKPNPMRRWDVLEEMIKERGWTKGVEVGVSTGRNFSRLLENCPSLHLTGVDIFEERPGLEKEGGQSFEGWNLPGHEKRLREMVERCYSTRGKLIKGYSTEVAKEFEDKSLDFVFLDGDHRHAQVREDILAWRPKVRDGGVLCGHDYQEKFPGVIKAVDDLCPGAKQHPDSVWELQC